MHSDGERCFCLKILAVLGGSYDIENIGTVFRLAIVKRSDIEFWEKQYYAKSGRADSID
jgi:hypothetical protein